MARLPGRSGPGRGGPDAIVHGLALLGRFRKDGFGRFDASTQGFLASLAPWLAFLLVGNALRALQGRPLEALTDFVVLVCWLLIPPVVSEAIAVMFRRDDHWLRYATATTWCDWLMAPVWAASLLVVSIGMEAGLPVHAVPFVLLGLMGVYWICLHLFLARSGLDLSPARSILLVLAVVAADLALLATGYAIGGPAAALFGV